MQDLATIHGITDLSRLLNYAKQQEDKLMASIVNQRLFQPVAKHVKWQSATPPPRKRTSLSNDSTGHADHVPAWRTIRPVTWKILMVVRKVQERHVYYTQCVYII